MADSAKAQSAPPPAPPEAQSPAEEPAAAAAAAAAAPEPQSTYTTSATYQGEGYISVDDDLLDSDSDYGPSLQSDTTSLKSSVMNYVFENGRRYHSSDAYNTSNVMPNDETEQDRLDLEHHKFLLILDGSLHMAPLGDNPQRILDVGCGTGIWALDMAEQYPSAEVVGIDLSPIQPNWVVPNCRFEVDNAEMNWTFPQNHFDFIHARNIAQSIKDWPRLLGQMYKHLQPGGYIQLSEGQSGAQSDDGTLPPNCAMLRFFERMNEGLTILGMPPRGPMLKVWTAEAGFEVIKSVDLKQPFSPWPSDRQLKRIGQCVLLMVESAFEAYGLALFTRVLGMDAKEAAELCDGARRDALNKRIHAYAYNYYVVARKPLDAT